MRKALDELRNGLTGCIKIQIWMGALLAPQGAARFKVLAGV